MNTGKFYFGIICALLLSISCNRPSRVTDRILEKAEAIVEQCPDSALVLLDSIPDARDLGKKQCCQYLLVQIQAKDKSYRDITSDTVIFDVKNYYLRTGNFNRTALASYYCGRVLQEQKNYEKAMRAYLDAEKYSKQNSNNNLNGLIQSSIGEVYYRQLLKDEAITRYKQANRYFHQAGNRKNEIITLNLIGNCFLLKSEQDSAFNYYHKGLALADQYNMVQEQAGIRQCMGVAYRQIGDLGQAKLFFKKGLIFPVDSLEKTRLYYNLASVSDEENHEDSARYYLERALNTMTGSKNAGLSSNIYELWSAIEEKGLNYREALEHHKIYSEYLVSILDENKNKAILEIQKKYDFQLIQRRNDQLLIGRQRVSLIAMGLFMVLILLFFIFYRQSIQNKKKLLEAEQKIFHLKELARSFDEKENSFRNILIRHFGILKKAALLEGYLREEERKKGQHLLKKFNEIVYGQEDLDWYLLYRTMNDLSNDLLDRLKKVFPQLDESEFRICCLSYAGLANTEIAIILKYSINTIQAKKSSIRKKLGIKTFGNIRDFLEVRVKNELCFTIKSTFHQ